MFSLFSYGKNRFNHYIAITLLLLPLSSLSGYSLDNNDTGKRTHVVEVFFPSGVFPVKLGEEIFNLHVADTAEMIQDYLSRSEELKDNEGMLFIFPTIDFQKLVMKNATYPTVVAFITEHGEIFDIHEIAPFSDEEVVSRESTQFAIALKKEAFERCNVEVGTQIVPVH